MTSSFAFNYCKPEVIKELQVIHYGSDKFDLSKFNGVNNIPLGNERGGSKPTGGLWTTPISSAKDWENFFSQELCGQIDHKIYFKTYFKISSKIIVINNLADLKVLPFERNTVYPDWKMLSNVIDAIWLTQNGCEETKYSEPYHLFGWDIESLFVMNPHCLQIAI